MRSRKHSPAPFILSFLLAFLTFPSTGRPQNAAESVYHLTCPVGNCGFTLQGLSPEGMRFEYSSHNLALHDRKVTPAEVDAALMQGEASPVDSTLLSFVCGRSDKFGVWSHLENEVVFLAGVHLRLAHESDVSDDAVKGMIRRGRP